MPYEILKTVESCDRKICYFIYKHEIQSEDGSAYTYGMSAFDIYDKCSVDDVLTDFEESVKLVEAAAEKSIETKRFNEFILDYLSDM